MARRTKDVPTVDPGGRRHLFGQRNRAALNSTMTTAEKVRLGGQYEAEEQHVRDRYFFAPETARRLRAATAKALGRRLGGGR